MCDIIGHNCSTQHSSHHFSLLTSRQSSQLSKFRIITRTLRSYFSRYTSLLPLTDPRDAVPHAHRAVHRCWRSVWQTGDRRPSPADHTGSASKLTAPDTIDVQLRNLRPEFGWNFLRKIPLILEIPEFPPAHTCLFSRFRTVPACDGNGVVWGHSRSPEIAPFDRAHASSY